MIPGIVAVQGAADAATDPYWANVVCLLHLDGADGSTTFTDQKGVVWAPAGNARISTVDPVFGTACYLGDGNNDYIRATTAGFAFGTDDFTIEFRVRQLGNTAAGSASATCILDMRTAEPSDAILLDSRSDGVLRLYVNGAYRITSRAGATTGGWHAIALSRAAGTTRLFVDGAMAGSWSDATNYASNTITLGGRFAAVSGDFRSLNGRIDEFRVTAGVARYTSAYTPAPGPFPDN